MLVRDESRFTLVSGHGTRHPDETWLKLLAETQTHLSLEPAPEITDTRSIPAGTFNGSSTEPSLLSLRSKPCPFQSEETA